jgi:hypothetical protein
MAKQGIAYAGRETRPAAIEELTELSGSRTPFKAPDRQRGLRSFLTWSFVFAPIVTVEALLARNSHAATSEDTDDRTSDHGKSQTDVAPSPDQASAGTVHAVEDNQPDQTNGGVRSAGGVQKFPHNSDLPQHEDHSKAHAVDDAGATALPSGSGGGGGSDTTSAADASSSPDDVDDSSTSSDSGVVTTGSSSDLTATSFGSTTGGISHPTAIGGSQVQSIGGGLTHAVTDTVLPLTGIVSPNTVTDIVTPLTGIVSPHTVTDIVAPLTGIVSPHTITGAVAPLADVVSNILAPVGLSEVSAPVDLKSLLGFDLHVDSNGDFVATDLGAALDQGHLLSTAATVSNVVHPTMDGLPVLNFATSNALDSLFGGGNHSSAPDHPGGLASVVGGNDIGDHDPLSSLKSISAGDSTASLDKLTESVTTAHLPSPIANEASAPAQLSILGEATSMTPGHSIDFPAPASPEGDVLFRGNNYTDYHVALQTVGPSSGDHSLATPLTSVPGIATDTTSTIHVESPTPTTPTSSSTAPVQHQDASLAHIAPTLDDLNLRGHTH